MGRPSYVQSGDRPSGGGGDRGGDRRPPRREFRSNSYNRRKPCQFCVDKISYIDYKDVNRLRNYLNERARIDPRRSSGTCAKHQRRLTVAIKRARTLALLPYTPEQLKALGFSRPQSSFGGRGRNDREFRPRYPRSDSGSSGGGYRGGSSSRPSYAPTSRVTTGSSGGATVAGPGVVAPAAAAETATASSTAADKTDSSAET